MDPLTEDIGRLMQKHGQGKVKNYFNRLSANSKEIPSHGPRRAMLNFLKASYGKGVIISESFLRSDVLLTNTSTITFSINESDGNVNGVAPTATTVRLNQNDTFEMTEWCVMLWTITTTGTVPAVSTRLLYTYPNPSVFAGGAVSGATESERLMALYNAGKLSLVIGTETIFSGLDCLRFYRVPTSQQGTTTTAYVNASSANATTTIARDGFSSAGYPWDASYPSITLSGNGKNKFQLLLPEGIDLTATSGQNRNNYISLWLRGYLCANGAKQMNRKFSPQ